MSFAFLSIATVSVDYGLVQVAIQPLIGQAYTPTSAAVETVAVLVLQAVVIIWSTRQMTRVNNVAVAGSADELAQRYGVSVETIRRDLGQLQADGLLQHVYGRGPGHRV